MFIRKVIVVGGALLHGIGLMIVLWRVVQPWLLFRLLLLGLWWLKPLLTLEPLLPEVLLLSPQ